VHREEGPERLHGLAEGQGHALPREEEPAVLTTRGARPPVDPEGLRLRDGQEGIRGDAGEARGREGEAGPREGRAAGKGLVLAQVVERDGGLAGEALDRVLERLR